MYSSRKNSNQSYGFQEGSTSTAWEEVLIDDNNIEDGMKKTNVSEVTVGAGAPGASIIGRRLRALLAEAMRNDKKYKEASLATIKNYYYWELIQELDSDSKKSAELFFTSEESQQYLRTLLNSFKTLSFSRSYKPIADLDIQQEENKNFYKKI